MKVKCLYNQIEDELARKVGLGDDAPRIYGSLTVGREYIVLGLTYSRRLETYAGHPVFEVLNEGGYITMAPSFLFEIIDGSASRHWQFNFRDGDILEFEPPSFCRPYYHDELSDGVPEVVRDFQSVCALLQEEEAEREEANTP